MKVILLTTNKFPRGDAGAIRDEAIVKALMKNGYDVIIIGFGVSTLFKTRDFQGIKYYSLRGEKSGFFMKANYRFTFLKKAKKIINRIKPDVLFVSTITSIELDIIKKYTKNNSIKLIYNCVEWYSSDEFNIGVFSPSYLDNNRINSSVIDKKMCVVSISSFLHDYFTQKGVESVRIPAILDIENIPFNFSVNKRKRIYVYGGSPGKKDRLVELIEAINYLEPNIRKKMEFRIIGVSFDNLINECGVDYNLLNNVSDTVKVIGRVSHDIVISNLLEADYSILFRDASKRFAKAGFPTKFAESLATATPVICNYSSDINLYLKDGKNGFACEGYDEKSLITILKRSINITDNEIEKMKKEARKTAEEKFDYRKYCNLLREIIGD